MSYKNGYQYSNFKRLFAGMNLVDPPDVLTEKGMSPYILNCYSYPDKGIAKFFGRSKHNSTTIGAAAEVTGIFELKADTPAFFCIAEAKFYKDNAGTWEDKSGAVTITDNKNNLWSFSKFQDVLIGTSLDRDAAIEHDGGAGNLANVSNMPAVKFHKPLANRLLAFNTLAQPKLGYWSGVNDRASWDLTNDFLNFKGSEADDNPITGAAEHQNTLLVAKENSTFRLYHTGTMPPFKYYRIDDKIGCISHHSMQSIPASGIYPSRVIWMGKDNFYQIIGDTITSIADDIKPFFSEGEPFIINQSRMKYAVSGIIAEKNLYLCAFTSGSGSANDYIFILDYKNMFWALCNFSCNSFGIRQVSNKDFLYSGTYTGFAAKHDPAVYNNLGAAYASVYWTPWIDWGDPGLTKKVKYLIGLFEAIGDFEIDVDYAADLGSFQLETGAAKLGIDFILGTSTLGGVEVTESALEINKRFKRIQLKLTQDTINEYFRLYALGCLFKPLAGYRVGS